MVYGEIPKKIFGTNREGTCTGANSASPLMRITAHAAAARVFVPPSCPLTATLYCPSFAAPLQLRGGG